MAKPIIIFNGKLVLPDGVRTPGWIQVLEGRIAAVGAGMPPAEMPGDRVDAGNRLILPGFIDLHVHGVAGVDVMDAQEASLHRMAEVFATHGVTSFLPTTWTASPQRTLEALRCIASCTGKRTKGATILGAHLEGPFLNPAKCGAQQVEHIRRAEREEAARLLDLDVIRLVALAPEFPENHWLIQECVRRGIAVSAAHTSATFAQMQHAKSLGLRQVTHMFNAMSPLHHREPGVAGAALIMPEIRCELIADNVHVHPALLAFLHRVKGRAGIILITDAVSAAELPDGEHRIDGRPVRVGNGAVSMPDGTLAGSTLMMDRALRNLSRATGEPVENLWETTSFNAAQAIGIGDRKGRLAPGMDADIVVIDEQCAVWLTMVEGQIVHASGKSESP
jgi:N-acetylglucosamine-6-phosphate deacetylase